MFKVVKDFVDLHDDNHLYRAGDKFPRDGVDVSEARTTELASGKNRCGVVLIKATEKAKIQPVGEEKAVVDKTVKAKPKRKKKEQ